MVILSNQHGCNVCSRHNGLMAFANPRSARSSVLATFSLRDRDICKPVWLNVPVAR
jgi:hypothetical protein